MSFHHPPQACIVNHVILLLKLKKKINIYIFSRVNLDCMVDFNVTPSRPYFYFAREAAGDSVGYAQAICC